MYFPIGWPKYIHLQDGTLTIYLFSNRDRSLFGVLTEDSIGIWFAKPCVQIVCHKRSNESLSLLGINKIAEWKPDNRAIVVATSQSHLLFYQLDMDDSIRGLYEQQDSKVASLKRESAELFIKEKIPPLLFIQAFSTNVPGDITGLVCIRDELMVSTTNGHIWRVHWDGTLNRDYCLNLLRIPFCADQQLSRALPLEETGLYVKSFEYSPLIGGFSIVLSNGRAAFITAPTLKFDPNQVVGIWAQELTIVTCTALNHRYRLIAYGLKSADGAVYCFDDLTGALVLTHKLILSSKDFPDSTTAAGAVTHLKWSPDGMALAMTWEKGGLAVWSVFGSLLMCTLGWDYSSVEILKNNPFRINSLEWGAEGYHLWMLTRHTNESNNNSQLNNEQIMKVAIMQFAKSALTVNAGMTGKEHVFLQAEDRLFISAGADIVHQFHSPTNHPFTDYHSKFNDINDIENTYENGISENIWNNTQMTIGNKQWIIVPIPYTYLGNNWPIRHASIDPSGQHVAVAGRSGLAHYSLIYRRWKLFGNETQEQDFVVMGGLLWWEDYLVLGCYNLRDMRDEIRLYPQETKLDNQFVRVIKVTTQVLQLSVLGDRLLSFCADSHLTLYHLQKKCSSSNSSLHIVRLHELDVSNLVVHPACVVSAILTSLRTEIVRWPKKGDESILLNVCGRLFLLQQDPAHRKTDTINNNQGVPHFSAPTVLASNVECVWVSSRISQKTPHLTEALWITCGSHGMRVWLPLFPRDGEKPLAHNFMSKRIMLPIDICIYPLALLFEDAVILGAENDTVLCSANSSTTHSLCIVSRTSQVYLHHILRQLLRRNLGYHAWEIAKSCATLPYFPHSLELLLHEVLEEEATSSEPIPDALLPRIIDFIREFPVFLQTVVQCARKTELALWPYLFSAVGNPRNLFQKCLNQGHLETAASYLIILQNLEVASVSRQHATLLLDSALNSNKWELSKELVRFLRAIDPSDVESPPRASLSMLPAHKFSFSHPTPPVSPTEDDLSFVLGTVSLTRGRAYSSSGVIHKMTSSLNENSACHIQNQDSKPTSEPRNIPEKKSVNKDKDSAEEFFIDTILTRHARKLLSAGRLKDLGYLSAHLDFHLVSFLKKERTRVAKIDDFITSLQIIHREFNWPFPVFSLSSPINLPRRSSGSSIQSSANVSMTGITEEKLKSTTANIPLKKKSSVTHEIGDSGYLSNSCPDIQSNDNHVILIDSAEIQPIEAHLSPRTQHAEDESLLTLDMSEDSSLWGEESHNIIEDGWSGISLSTELEIMTQELASRGPPQSEVQLRYLLQLMLEASCLDWSLLIAFVLRDAMAVIRVVNAARQPEFSQEVAQHLKDGLTTLENWIDTHCLGYKPFMLAIRNQIKALTKIITTRPQVLKFQGQFSLKNLHENSLSQEDEGNYSLSTCNKNSIQEINTNTENTFKEESNSLTIEKTEDINRDSVIDKSEKSSDCNIS